MANPSELGGFEEFFDVCPSRTSSSAIRTRAAPSSADNNSINSSRCASRSSSSTTDSVPGTARSSTTPATRSSRHADHRDLTSYAASTTGRLRLFFLPPYSPEPSPDERVWKNVKHDRVGKTAITSFDDLRDKAKSALLRLQRLPDLVRAFFSDPCLSYIK
ncbi:MAG: transposase [Pseudonocardiales bacterium]|nr:transposase [Pseudonocardiales bacterium]